MQSSRALLLLAPVLFPSDEPSHFSVLSVFQRLDVPPKRFPPVWRWRWGCWNSPWIFTAYPGSHEGIIPKAFQELDPGFMQIQLMLALQIGVKRAMSCPLFWLLCDAVGSWFHACTCTRTEMQVSRSLQATRSANRRVYAGAWVLAQTRTHKSRIITHRAA